MSVKENTRIKTTMARQQKQCGPFPHWCHCHFERLPETQTKQRIEAQYSPKKIVRFENRN